MKINYAQQAYECFIKNAEESDVSDPVAAIENHFQANATDELKAKCAAEGKTAAKAFAFLAAVARKCPRKNGGVHIPPVIGFAICMHYFQDVPVDWDAPEVDEAAEKAKDAAAVKRAKKIAHERRVKIAAEHPEDKEFAAKVQAEGEELEREEAAADAPRKEKPAKKSTAKAPRKKVKKQEFFFDLLETPVVGPSDEGKEAADAH